MPPQGESTFDDPAAGSVTLTTAIATVPHSVDSQREIPALKLPLSKHSWLARTMLSLSRRRRVPFSAILLGTAKEAFTGEH